MAISEFEEKSFEGPLNCQLLGNSRYLYSPGQVLEQYIGFDAALYVQNPLFWSIWSRNSPMRGRSISGNWWRNLPSPPPPFPSFNVNLFIQCKRPHYLKSRRASQWSSWNSPYYRYSTISHQQVALEDCSIGLGDNGLVVYAAPAFHKSAQLFNNVAAGTLVQNSNFVRVQSLSGHSVYTYVASGNRGQAFSEPSGIEPVNILAEIAHIHEHTQLVESFNIFQVTGEIVRKALNKHTGKEYFKKFEDYIEMVLRPAINKFPDAEDGLRDYLWVSLFAWSIGFEWSIIGPPS